MIMNTEEVIRGMMNDLTKKVNDIVFAEKHNTLNELWEQVWNRYKQIDYALYRNYTFISSEGHVNCKRYRYMDYCDIRHRLYAKSAMLTWFMYQICKLDK